MKSVYERRIAELEAQLAAKQSPKMVGPEKVVKCFLLREDCVLHSSSHPYLIERDKYIFIVLYIVNYARMRSSEVYSVAKTLITVPEVWRSSKNYTREY